MEIKKYLYVILIALSFGHLNGQESSNSQKSDFNKYTFSELLEMINAEKDSVFILKNAFISIDEKTDTLFNYNRRAQLKKIDSVHINKEIRLENVHFKNTSSREEYGFYFFQFKKKITFLNCSNFIFRRNNFKAQFDIQYNESQLSNNVIRFNKTNNIYVSNSTFEQGIFCRINSNSLESPETIWTRFTLRSNSIFPSTDRTSVFFGSHSMWEFNNILNLNLEENNFFGSGVIQFRCFAKFLIIQGNTAKKGLFNFAGGTKESSRIKISKNYSSNPFLFSNNLLSEISTIDWNQFQSGLIDEVPFFNLYRTSSETPFNLKEIRDLVDDNVIDYYQDTFRYSNLEAYKEEIKLLGKFHDFYKDKHDNDFANQVYVSYKNLETERMRFLYNETPSFQFFFKWRINQFLKVFSNYGTQPEKAVIFSIYVILFFSLVYLFFPNTWDSHGKNRIIDRYTFFFTYMRSRAGIHQVYLENKKNEMMSYEAFKSTITQSDNKVPKFFTRTALPLYKWALSGTKLSAWLLKRIDIIKGKWSELSPAKRFGKSILLIGAFLVAIIYDITIKVLNALMLSINTFTTLGFGEIPIKGLPRYLAIIQGFIGWFMLTIFSVSLISQLLN